MTMQKDATVLIASTVQMENTENKISLIKEILTQRLQSHREYISRQWQYYAAFLLLNGLVVNAIKELGTATPVLVIALGIATVATSGVFFHLVNWANMRIFRNAVKINELAGQALIEIPKANEGITPWLLFSIMTFTLCWLVWLFQVGFLASLLGLLLFLFIVGNSILSTRKWLKSVSS